MRRLHALLVAGLMAAPLSAVAGPDAPKSDDDWSETFEWSMSTSRARLGVMAVGLTPELRKHFGAPEDRGVMIDRVQPNSAAAAAGLAVGDILTEVKGAPVDSAADVLSSLASAKKGDAVPIMVLRSGKYVGLTATMTEDAAPVRMMSPRVPRWFKDWLDETPGSWHQPPQPKAPRGTTKT